MAICKTKYRILERVMRNADSAPEPLRFEYRAQYKTFLFWDDCVKIDHGHYCSDWVAKVFDSREQAEEAIRKHARDNAVPDIKQPGWKVI